MAISVKRIYSSHKTISSHDPLLKYMNAKL